MGFVVMRSSSLVKLSGNSSSTIDSSSNSLTLWLLDTVADDTPYPDLPAVDTAVPMYALENAAVGFVMGFVTTGAMEAAAGVGTARVTVGLLKSVAAPLVATNEADVEVVRS